MLITLPIKKLCLNTFAYAVTSLTLDLSASIVKCYGINDIKLCMISDTEPMHLNLFYNVGSDRKELVITTGNIAGDPKGLRIAVLPLI